MSGITKEKALEYHKNGKIGIDLTKPCSSQHELSLASKSVMEGKSVLFKKFANVDAFDIELDIPVFHDNQHGTAIITTAGLMNVLELTGKKAEEIKIVVNGAGATGISYVKMYQRLGVKHIILCDSKRVISTDRDDLNEYKAQFAVETQSKTLDDAIEGADMFLGLSVAGALSKEMVAKMAPEPNWLTPCAGDLA